MIPFSLCRCYGVHTKEVHAPCGVPSSVRRRAYSIDGSSARSARHDQINTTYSLLANFKSAIRAASFTYFGEVLSCPRKSMIVTITKVYIARNNIHVEIIRFHTN